MYHCMIASHLIQSTIRYVHSFKFIQLIWVFMVALYHDWVGHNRKVQKINPPLLTVWHLVCSTHTEIFTKSYSIKPKSDCIYHFALIWNQTDVCLLFKINRTMVNTIWFRFDLIKFRNNFSMLQLPVWNFFTKLRRTSAPLSTLCVLKPSSSPPYITAIWYRGIQSNLQLEPRLETWGVGLCDARGA